MHANASTQIGNIVIGEPLFKAHKMAPAEIVAVLVHELGHFSLSHLIKQSVVDTLYMVIYGALLLLCINQPAFLLAFGFP